MASVASTASPVMAREAGEARTGRGWLRGCRGHAAPLAGMARGFGGGSGDDDGGRDGEGEVGETREKWGIGGRMDARAGASQT